ncbi:MAG: hypothetical protein M0R06_08265 [Sphaerochaeta sp.]|jgi:hypothetical protein|nr:hypothetical protein [Sphaerochaeta sp.]
MLKASKGKIDVGLAWAKYVNIYGQVGAVAGTVQMMSTLAILYTTTIQPNMNIPIWLYVLAIIAGTVLAVTFVLKVGISGYYRFFNQHSDLAETNERVQETDRKLKLIMDKLGIDDTADTTGSERRMPE